MKRLLREPLLHFFLLGAAIFGAFQLTSRHEARDPGSIVVTRGTIESLAMTFARTWQRPPNDAELEGLIRDYVREEVYYREALALGLDRDDTVVKRRLRQKLEFVSEDLAARAEPTDEELRAYLDAHPDAFRVGRRFTFRQVYINPARRRETLARDAAKLLAELNRAGARVDTTALGDPFLLEHSFRDVPGDEVVKQFGDRFAARLAELPTGRWQGPVESGYGVHLILIDARTEGRLPAFDDVRDAVRRDWANARRTEANERFYQSLLGRFTVTIERAGSTDAGARAATK